MAVFVYIQGRGKAHDFRPGHLPDEVRPYVWRVRTKCGQQLDDTYRTYYGYVARDWLCTHCFPSGGED